MLVWLIFAFLLERANIFIAKFNYGTHWNGIGAIDGVINKNTDAPMVYRVLFPWLVRATKGKRFFTITVYEFWKVIFTALALWSVSYVWGWKVAVITALILPATFLYDYWDWAPEMLGISLALSGNIYLALIGITIHALSRETAPLDALAYILVTSDFMGALILVGVSLLSHVVLRLIQGEHKLYCQRWMIKENLQLIKAIPKETPFWLSSTFISILLTITVCVGIAYNIQTALIPLVILVAGWTMAKGDETRVFTAAIPWAAYALGRLIQ